jgi:hypothetical protein
MYRRLRILLLIAATALLLHAQPDEISTDRPDYTESTDTVGRGIGQLEGGLLWTSEAPRHTLTVPNALLRIGIARRLELRLASDGFVRESVLGNGTWERNSGGADLAIGAKLALVGERRLLPALSVIGALSLPVGSPRFSSGGYDPFFKLCWSKSLPKAFDAGGNVVAQLATAGPGTSVEQSVSLSVGHKLPGGLRGFWEVYRISPHEAQTIADTGLSRILGKNVEIDVLVGHTLLAQRSSWFAGAGFGIRRR